MLPSAWGWKRPVWVQFNTNFIPGGSVNRKTPHLQTSVSGHGNYGCGHTFDLLVLAWCADNRNTLRHHDLIATVRVEITTAHEACLRWMGMYPAQNH